MDLSSSSSTISDSPAGGAEGWTFWKVDRIAGWSFLIVCCLNCTPNLATKVVDVLRTLEGGYYNHSRPEDFF